MASPTQTIVGKGKPNPLIAEGLLKILRESIPTHSHQSHLSIPINGVISPEICSNRKKTTPVTLTLHL